MKVKRSDTRDAPDYPSRRDLLKCGAVLGAATIGLTTMAGGCRIVGVPIKSPPPEVLQTTGGVMPVEPDIKAPATPYVVQRGDTLYGLALRFLNDGDRWPDIVQANPGLTPKTLKAGQTIVIPSQPTP